MLVDFCHWSMKTVVTSTVVSSDGYDAENLVSKDFVLKSKGFLAERFLKPPVSITFTFPCSINIHRVIINPVVGFQKSSALELLTNIRMTPVNLGRTTMDNPAVVCFFNSSFHARPPYSIEDSDLTRFRYIVEMKNSYAVSLVSFLTIRITRTFDSLIPGIRSVSIFGQPSHKYDKGVHEEIFTLYAQSLNHQCPPTLSSNDNSQFLAKESKQPIETKASTESKGDAKTPSCSSSNFEVPEEFVDPITCEVMALPTLLPCGKSVDHNTLGRYVENEATYGRHPNDPFTGVAFNTENFPVPNNSLKVRIDKFLLQHSDEEQVKCAPRTLGRKQDVSINDTKLKDAQNQNDNAASRTNDLSLQRNSITKRKSKCLDSFDNKFKLPKLESTENISTFQDDSMPAHKCRLDSSLDDAMSILRQLPSFTSSTSSVIVDANSPSVSREKMCTNCETLISASAMYQLVCGHCICRLCLCRITSRCGKDVNEFGRDSSHSNQDTTNCLVKCSTCKQMSNRNDVFRIFQ